MATTHHLDDTQPHAFWDNTLPPRITIAPGDTVVFETLEASANQITPDSGDDAVANLSFDVIHPLTGPVAVEGAEPGDTLEVEILDMQHKGWGWNAVIPGFGLLPDDFSNAYLHHYQLQGNQCVFRSDILIPFEPFCGVMGVGPAEAGRFDTVPPARQRWKHRYSPPDPRSPCLLSGADAQCALFLCRLPFGAG